MPQQEDPPIVPDPGDPGAPGGGGGGGGSSYGGGVPGGLSGFPGGSPFGGSLRRLQMFRGVRGFGDNLPVVIRGRGLMPPGSGGGGKGGFNPTSGAPASSSWGMPGAPTDGSGEPLRQGRNWQPPGGGGQGGGSPGGGFTGFTGRGGGGGFVQSSGGFAQETPYGMPRRKMQAGGLQSPTGFSHGGEVPDLDGGVPGPTDTVPAMLTPNEMVMNTGVTSDPTIAAILTLLNILGAHHNQNGMGVGGMDGMEEEPQGVKGYGLGGWIKGAALAGGALLAAPAVAGALGIGAAGAGAGAAGAAGAAIPAVGASGAGLSIGPMAAVPAAAHSVNTGAIGTMTRFAQSHPKLAKYAAEFGSAKLAEYLNPPPSGGGTDYMQPYPQPQGYAFGGAVRPQGTFGNFGTTPAAGRAEPMVAPAPAASTPGTWGSRLGGNPDLGGARTAGYFDPRGNQMLINSQREAAQGTADALVRRQMSQADLGGLDPAQRAVAKLQALQGTGRGVQDIMAQTRAGALTSQNEFYQRQYMQEQAAEEARLAAQRAYEVSKANIEETGIQNRRTKKSKGK